MRLLKTMSALLALTLAYGNANAQQTSTAVVGDVAYRLVDLAPNDGIAPSLTFSTFSSIDASIATNPSTVFNDLHSAFSYDQSPSFSVANNIGAASGSGTIHGSTLTTTGQLNGAGGYYTSASQSSMFSLSANTQLIVTGHAQANVKGDLTLPDMAGASIWFQIIDSQHATPFGQLAFYSNGAYSYNGLPTTVEEDFTLNFYNHTTSVLNGTIDIYSGVYAMQSPVPEPATYGMLIAGAGWLAAAARRRKA